MRDNAIVLVNLPIFQLIVLLRVAEATGFGRGRVGGHHAWNDRKSWTIKPAELWSAGSNSASIITRASHSHNTRRDRRAMIATRAWQKHWKTRDEYARELARIGANDELMRRNYLTKIDGGVNPGGIHLTRRRAWKHLCHDNANVDNQEAILLGIVDRRAPPRERERAAANKRPWTWTASSSNGTRSPNVSSIRPRFLWNFLEIFRMTILRVTEVSSNDEGEKL